MRIDAVSMQKAGWFTRLVYSIAKRKIGKLTGQKKLIDPIRVMAHHTRVLMGVAQMDAGQDAAKSVPSRIKHLALIRVARMVGCPF